ncbi:MAG TPA: ankyrin repeat domain-containing protein [Gammaproteobacteria bacterium]
MSGKFRCFPHLAYALLILALLALTAACNSERYTTLMNAARNGDTEAVRKMLDLGAEADQKTSRGKTALMLAAAGGYTDTVKLLVDRGADINTRDNYDTTAIIAAATAGHEETSAALMAYGADPMFKDTSGGSALNNATFFGHSETVLTILALIPELPADAGNELLLLAAGLGHEKIAAALLDKGVSVNALGIKDRTPLMAATAFNKPQLVKLLLGKGADTTITDTEGFTALQIAENKGNLEIISLLRAAQPVTESNSSAPAKKSQALSTAIP